MSSSESTLMMILTHQLPSLTTALLRNIIQFLLYSKHLLYYIINVSPHIAKSHKLSINCFSLTCWTLTRASAVNFGGEPR